MKKKNWIIITAVLILILTAALPVMAAAAGGIKMELPVETSVSGGYPQTPEKFSLVLTALTPDAPMPQGSTDGVYSFTSTGIQTQNLVIEYPKLGIYKYTLAEEKGSNELCHYDEAVYNIEVSVTNSKTDDSLVLNVAINREGETEKCPNIIFNNKYDYPPSDKPKTGDESGLMIWLALMSLSLAATAAVLKKVKN